MGVALKFYSCVGSNHSTLDAIRALQAEQPFGEADIERIVVHGSRVTMDHVGWNYEPQGLTSAQLNLPYCVATWLLDGDVFVDQFTEAMVADPERMRVAKESVRERRRSDHCVGLPGASQGACRGFHEGRYLPQEDGGSRSWT
jgi:2-methylcitrate dehydratase PrpD